MAIWQWLVDSAGFVLLLVLLYGLALVVRRRALSRHGGTFELSYRARAEHPGRGWLLGIGRYSGQSLEWFRIFSLSPRPKLTFRRSELEYGCNPMILDASDPDRVIEMTRPDQLGGFLQDDDGLPIVYGVSPYPQAVQVRVQGVGVDRKLPVRADSQGYGAAFPEVPRPVDISLTFTDAAGRVLGTKRILVPND